jgi:hypothetical protein
MELPDQAGGMGLIYCKRQLNRIFFIHLTCVTMVHLVIITEDAHEVSRKSEQQAVT